jgi:hypothetical protein
MIPDRAGKCGARKKFEEPGKTPPPLVLQNMTTFDHDDLPPDLSDLGRRMRDERPVAEDDALDRMMQRANRPARQAPRRAPRRAFAASLATTIAMLSVTGVAAAALFGMSLGSIGSALTNSNKKIGTATSQALRAPAPSGSGLLSGISSPGRGLGGGLGNLTGRAPSLGGSAPAIAAGPSASLLPGFGNAGNFQYRARRLVCRILRALGLNFVARLLGCP